MAARTTAEKVQGIIEVDATIADISPFIEVANELVTECCGEVGYTENRLLLIETWLAAHFYAIRDPRTTSEAAGSVSASFQSRVDLGLDVTHYGQQAKRLDTAGGLAVLDENSKKGTKPRIGMFWAGTDSEESNL